MISESIFVKRLKWVLMIQNWYQSTWPLMCGCMWYVHCSSKVNRHYCSIIGWSGYCHSRYIYQLIHRGATAGSILQQIICTLSCSLDLDVLSNDLHAGIPNDCVCCFCWLCPCRFLFHMLVMIPVRSCSLFGLAITSVEGCCLYIIIHNSILHQTWL